MSSGTGYSEPDKFHIVTENGWEGTMWVDIWYVPEDSVKKEFIEGVKRVMGNKCTNIDEAFEMYKAEIKKTGSCPYFWMDDYKK